MFQKNWIRPNVFKKILHVLLEQNLKLLNCVYIYIYIYICIYRGGFRGGDLVTCHSLFSDMTLQSEILVIESLFLTLVSKFIRKYLLSDTFQTCTPLALIPLLSLSNLATIFFRKNYR